MTALQKTKRTATERFHQLAKTWKSETELVSKVTKRILHPAYQKIIGMGESAVPLILKDLSERTKLTNSWALAKKAGISPFVVQKALNIAQRYSLAELKIIYRTLSDFDIQIKTGKIESRVALELLIFELCKKVGAIDKRSTS